MVWGFSGRGALQAATACSLAALAAACSQSSNTPSRGVSSDAFDPKYGVSSSPRLTAQSEPVRRGGGTYKLGVPYKIGERWYVPREEPGYDRQGIGSWYGDDFHGRKTANGEIFDMHALTAAHPTLPLPSYAYVTNLATGRTIMVRVNDHGPYANDRIIDMSHASARALGYENQGTSRVRVRYAGRAPLNGDDRREHQFLAEQPWYRGGAVASASPPPPNAPRTLAEPFPAGTAGRWSASGYRAALAGKSMPAAQAPMARPYAAARPAPQAYLAPTAYAPSYPARAGLGGQPTGAIPPAKSYVQVGVFHDRANAERLQRELASVGPVEVAPQGGSSSSSYRVRIGPLQEAELRSVLTKVAARGVGGSTIVSE